MAGDYHPPTLVQVPSKGNRWYVYVTKPKALQKKGGKQAKKSTNTTDERIARQRMHGIAQEIYDGFDRDLKPERYPLQDAIERLVSVAPELASIHEFKVSSRQLAEVSEDEQVQDFIDSALDTIRKVAEGLTHDPNFNKSEAAVTLRDTLEGIEKEKSTELLSKLLPKFLKERRWNREGSRREAERYVKRFIELVGDKNLSEIKKKDAYDLARAMDSLGLSNSAIKAAVSYNKGLLDWAVENGYLEQSPWSDRMSFKGYGSKKQSYRPFEKGHLHKLFELEMPDQDRLMFMILITTGMRLDEAALLTWEDVVTDADVPHFDLRDSIVKTGGSERFVPIPDVLLQKLPKKGEGRLFSYPLDQDGKAQKKASQALGRHIRKIRDHEKQVTHGLRGTLKDLLRDSGVSKEVNDFITGHAQGDSAGKYGSGPSLKVRLEALNSVDHPWL
ncbi:tyrosine-type recombinase/integrase [Aestuariicoccus sp. MJ-SS9]|uniref:tyrosine-type recombinase/integrase n=1 Tax=Aestuariicoccus sp. MJ-SS9 TaxID=3079855 RepID=UPI002909C68F|nr:tyrosine-type recombinase/integrase [Aestuariicoccus sp. MJ-SS9]MDU8913365.1 tyrosine-type recombinase/integrase [Aestuariicoccus sp. MJ-SS9]